MTEASPRTRPSDRYATVAIVLHWLIAAGIIAQVALAGRMEGPKTPEVFAVTQLHKSIGITILLLSLVRLAWRLANPPPPLPAAMPRWEKTLSHLTHIGFYGIMIGMPLTGWIIVSTSRIAVPTLLYGVVPWPHIPGLAELAGDPRKLWHEIGETGHGLIIKGFYGLIGLHVAGALKHQLFSRDEPVLARMAPGAKGGRWLEPRLLIIALGVIATIAVARLVQPPLPPTTAPPPQAPIAPTAPVDASAFSVEAPAADAATPGAPARWVVERGSEIEFSTTWGGTEIRGRFDAWTAAIAFSPDALDQSKVSVSIDVASVKTGDAQRDQSLPTEDWFDAAAHPRATFAATRFEKTGEDRYVAHGKLTLRGATRPLSLPFRLQIDGDKARVRGVTSLDRTAFGVGQGEWKSTDQIPAKVTVSVDLKAKRG